MPPADNPLSLDEIVSDLIVRQPEPPAKPTGKAAASGDTAAPEGAADESEDEHEPPRDPGSRTPEGDEEELEPPVEEPDGDEPDGEDDDEDPSYEVKVGGRTQTVKLSQLVANWSGEQTIAARLQEATEARNAATRAKDLAIEQERTAARQTIEAERTQLRQQIDNLAAIYTHYGDAILTPTVQPPDPAMRATDPIGYLTQMEAYRSEEDRLARQRQHMTEVVEHQRTLQTQQTQEFAQAQAQELLREVPAMRDDTYRRAQVKRVQEVGRAVGFTDEEITHYTTDRRTIYLAMLAAEGYEALMKRNQTGDAKAKLQKPAAVPAPTARVRTMASMTAKRKAIRERARKTGDVEDVAQTLIVPAKPRPRGRPQA